MDPRRLASNSMSAARAANAESRVLNTLPYYSRVIFAASKDGSNAFTFKAEKLRAFSYGLGDPVKAVSKQGGSSAIVSLTATTADTNLSDGSQTNQGETFVIWAIGILPQGITDWEVYRQISAEISAEARFGQSQAGLLGPIALVPGGGGVYGSGRQDITAAAASVGQASNGIPDAANLMWLKEGLVWSPPSEPDSNFSIVLEQTRDVTVQGVAGSPATARIDLLVHLYGEVRRPRSLNA